MKRIGIYAIVLFLVTLLNACGVGVAMISNHNQNDTQVHLSENNFKVIANVSGSSEASYVMFVGGMKKKQLYENAYSEMLKNANLLNGSKAIINVLTEEHASGFAPFYLKRTITVSAQVVEFTR